MPLQTLENGHWQVGIVPETGSSTAFGRVRRDGAWIDVLRPTAPADYGNASLCASFIMLPWCNRLRDARFRFAGNDYQLQPSSSDGTAIHGTVRRLPWKVESADAIRAVNTFRSADFETEAINFPWKFSARAEFRLDASDFVIVVTLTNEDTQPFSAGFGHHPYFVRDAANAVQLEIPCDEQFALTNALASAPPVPIPREVDFRTLRPLGTRVYEDLLTGRRGDLSARLVYPEVSVSMLSDALFEHVLLFAPEGKPFFAIEPQSNANDGFNLFNQGITESGVFVLSPGESRSGTVTLRVELMMLLGLQLSFKRSAYVGTALLTILLLVTGLALIHLTPIEAILGALVGAALYWSGETIHQIGHAWAAAGVGYPMTGIRYWGLLSTSLYPPDEPPLPGSTHIRRALGGPFFSLIYSLIAAVLVAIFQPESLLWWLAVLLTISNVFVFTLGALLPLNWTDGGTILKWWGRHTEEG